MEIIKAKVTKDNSLVATYKNEHGDTVTVEGKNIVTKDLTNAFRKLVPHLTMLCEQKEASHADRMDELTDEMYSVLEVTGYSIGGSDNSEGVTLSGKRFLKSKKVLNLNAPFTMFDNENEEYKYAFELQQEIEACNYEVEQYLFNKKWAIVQQELPFDGEAVTNDVLPDDTPEAFQDELEKIAKEAGATVQFDVSIPSRMTRKKKVKETAA